MDITGIQNSVQNFWKDILPSFIQLFVLLFITFILIGKKSSINIIKGIYDNVSDYNFNKINNVLKAIYIDKTIPFLLIFLILSFTYTLNSICISIGNMLPINISIKEPDLLASSVPDNVLEKIWSYYPNIDSLFDLQLVIEDEVLKESTNSGSYLNLHTT